MTERPHPSEIIRPPSVAAIPALIALGGNVMMLNLLAAAGGWVVYVADPGDPRVRGVRDVLALGSLGELVVTVAAGVAVIVWLWRARTNADIIDDLEPGWGRPWVIFGWVVPIVSLWVPCSIVRSVWRVSAPHGRSTWPVTVWWTAWLVYLLGGRVADADADGFQASVYPFVAVAGALAALFAMVIVWQITRFQEAQAIRLREALMAGV